MVATQIFFIFIPTWGNDPIWRAYFSNGLKPPTSKDIQSMYFSMFHTMECWVLRRHRCLQCFYWSSRWLCEGVTNLARVQFRGPLEDLARIFPRKQWQTVKTCPQLEQAMYSSREMTQFFTESTWFSCVFSNNLIKSCCHWARCRMKLHCRQVFRFILDRTKATPTPRSVHRRCWT